MKLSKLFALLRPLAALALLCAAPAAFAQGPSPACRC